MKKACIIIIEIIVLLITFGIFTHNTAQSNDNTQETKTQDTAFSQLSENAEICVATPPKEEPEAGIFTKIIAFLVEILRSIINWFSTIIMPVLI